MSQDPSYGSKPSAVASLLWTLLCLVMWFWAIVGPVYVLAGAVSHFIDLGDLLSIPGWEALSLGGVLGAVGISFVWLRMRRYIKFGGE